MRPMGGSGTEGSGDEGEAAGDRKTSSEVVVERGLLLIAAEVLTVVVGTETLGSAKLNTS